MPKFTKTEEQLETKADQWLYLFKHLPELQEPPEQLKERIFDKLFNAAEVANFDRVERDRYEQSLRAYRDLENVLSSAHLEGMGKGLEQGIQRGIQQGIQTGIEQGSTQTTLRIIQNALAKGFSIAEVAELVGLPQEEIEKLINL